MSVRSQLPRNIWNLATVYAPYVPMRVLIQMEQYELYSY